MEVTFDQVANSKNKFITGIIMHLKESQMVTITETNIMYEKAHQLLGHANENYIRWTAE